MHFLNMGGYAAYVWPAYCGVFLFLVIFLWVSKNKLSKIIAKTIKDHASTT